MESLKTEEAYGVTSNGLFPRDFNDVFVSQKVLKKCISSLTREKFIRYFKFDWTALADGTANTP